MTRTAQAAHTLAFCRCKNCKSYDDRPDGKKTTKAGECRDPLSPRPVTTPEATCDEWTKRP